uniref:Exopolygalacturonase n=1 Tax=Heterorhabditis bacteriophora TaxID=37862 RepID=A0A1I7WQT8_HETBA
MECGVVDVRCEHKVENIQLSNIQLGNSRHD